MNEAIIRKSLFVIRGVEEVVAHHVCDGGGPGGVKVEHFSVIVFTDRGLSIESHITTSSQLDELVEFTENLCLDIAHKRKYKIKIKVVD